MLSSSASMEDLTKRPHKKDVQKECLVFLYRPFPIPSVRIVRLPF